MQLNAALEQYVATLLSGRDEPVLLEMERDAQARDFPAVGRMVGVVLEILARSIGARSVFELGSGFGYSAYWFARAVGPEGEVHLTDNDPENERRALDYLARAGVEATIRFHVGDALETFTRFTGPFDIVFCDIDKAGYPDAWDAARDRIRPGGLYICDNTLGFGSASIVLSETGRRGEWLDAIRRHNEAVFSDDRFASTILPIRDGVLVALRVA